jgi:hypothetical protein
MPKRCSDADGGLLDDQSADQAFRVLMGQEKDPHRLHCVRPTSEEAAKV